MSLRALRRSLIAASAAVAVAGSLAAASGASGASIPTGSPTDSGGASLYGLLNQTDTALVRAEDLIALENGILLGNGQAPIDANFTTAFTTATSLNASNVAEIGADIASSANTANLAFGTCVSTYLAAASLPPTPANVTAGASHCNAAPADLSAATTEFTGTTQPGVAAATASWAGLNGLIAAATADPTDFPGGLFTVDGDVSVSSSAKVTGVGQPVAYTASFGVSGAAASGFVIPSGFTLTFPADFTIHAALIADEIQASQVANPPATDAIGTATVTSPAIAALLPGSRGVDTGGQVFVVQGASLIQPRFEVYLGHGDYVLGTPTGASFPLTIAFGEPIVGGQPTPLPVARVTLNFPAATSPLQAKSCTNLGTLEGTMTDSVSTLAATSFGDTTDSGALPMAATPTRVTNACAAAVRNTATGSMGRLTTSSPTLTLRVRTARAFSTVAVGLPRGLHFVTSKRVAGEVRVAGARIRSVRIARGRLVLVFRRAVRTATIRTGRSLINESAALIRSIRRHRTRRLIVSVHAGVALRAVVRA